MGLLARGEVLLNWCEERCCSIGARRGAAQHAVLGRSAVPPSWRGEKLCSANAGRSLASMEQIAATPARVEVLLGCCKPVHQLARCSVLLTKEGAIVHLLAQAQHCSTGAGSALLNWRGPRCCFPWRGATIVTLLVRG